MRRDRPPDHPLRPSYLVDGVVHYCVTNMPAAVPHTSTLALTNATFPYLLKLANLGAIGRSARTQASPRASTPSWHTHMQAGGRIAAARMEAGWRVGLAEPWPIPPIIDSTREAGADGQKRKPQEDVIIVLAGSWSPGGCLCRAERLLAQFLNPPPQVRLSFFTGLSALAFLLFVTVLMLLVRNVLKLYADSAAAHGHASAYAHVWGAALVSLVPIIFMAIFSYGLMNRAVDRWFSQPVTELRDDSNRMAQQLAQYTSANARTEAETIAVSLSVTDSISQAAKGDRAPPP